MATAPPEGVAPRNVLGADQRLYCARAVGGATARRAKVARIEGYMVSDLVVMIDPLVLCA
jgi:hypothetical protein